MMPHGHGVDNCSLPFFRKGSQLGLEEGRLLTKIFERNLILASYQLEFVGIYIRIRSRSFGDDCYGDDGHGDDCNGDDGEC
jgi:hypothetical protein